MYLQTNNTKKFLKRKDASVGFYNVKNMAAVDPDEYVVLDEFQDALEDQPEANKRDLEISIEDTRHAVNLFFNNQFDEAVAYMEPKANESMYHSLGFATLSFIKAVMTCDEKDVNKAVGLTKIASSVCEKFRKPNNLTDRLVNLSISADENNYTQEQLHAELCYAEALLERALLTFVQDENLMNFIKGAVRSRTCYMSYKKCVQYLVSHFWTDENIRSHYESGVKLGYGTFNLLVSALPQRVLRLLEFAGFSGDRVYALNALKSAAFMHHTLRWPLSALVLLVWNLIVVYCLGTGESDLELSKTLIRTLLMHFPKSSLVLFFAGRYAEIHGNFIKTEELLQKSIDQQSTMRGFHHICFWELMFCNSFQQNWKQAFKYADLLYVENHWSRSSYAYFCASLLIAQNTSDCNANVEENREKILQYMRQVPLLKVKLSGKSLPLEKFCVTKSAQFFNHNFLFIPIYELIYFYGGFSCLANNEIAMKAVLEDIESKYKLLAGHSSSNLNVSADDYCLYLFMKAMCLKHLQSPFQAEQCLMEVISRKVDLKVNTYLLSNAYLEIALLHYESGNVESVKNYLTKAKECKNYLVESRTHFRIHSLEMRLKNSS
ncbi:Tetratricopeptide repeat protein 39B [Trichinella spiralis]|uniref:Tetratricopeptide repeat protein 39B n=1 Tax=Trichinella spiralis TaxID=6334 RepID=A0ABR3KK49_TRISP